MITMKFPSLRHLSRACCVAVLLASGSAVAANNVSEQIELGLELYQEGSYGEAITELEFAITDIRKLISGRIAETFPDAPAGWTAQATASSGGSEAGAGFLGALGGSNSLSRQYEQDGRDGQMEATVDVDNPMIQGLAAMMSNPALLAAQPNTERIRVGRDTGSLTWDPERNRAEATLMIDGRIMIKVTGSQLSGPEPVRTLLNSWDIKTLRAATAR